MTQPKHLKLFVLMLLIACLTGFASDIYIPSLLKMAQDLGVPVNNIQKTMTIFMLGISISQLLYGPLSEVIGRRIPLILGLSIMSIGNIICFYAAQANMLLIGRLIQGLGVGACSCLWRTIFRDSFNSTQIAKYGGYIGIGMVLIVASAPALGGYLESYFGWKTSFLAIIVYSLITILLICFTFKETSIHHNKDRFNIYFFKDAFAQLLSSSTFMGYTFCVFLTYGAFFSWFIIGPVLLIDNLGLTPTKFGLINFCLAGTSMILAGFFNGKMIGRLGRPFMLRLGWILIFLSGLMMMCWNGQALFPITVFIFIFLFGSTLIWPSCFAEAFAPFGNIAGCAGSLYSFMQLGGGALIGHFSSLLPSKNSYSLSIIFICTSIISLIIFELVNRKKKTII